ncbi:MAG: proline--tRNA ligase, partial [Dehalococcoidia bacterium]|nr:proline--tRNA ligase [Dehalococcoidia bacterium]
MPTRLSTFFGRTLRQPPAEAELISHQLMLRAGLVQPVVSGVFAFLPLGWAVVRRIEQIIREEMDREGGQEVMLPILTPSELWEQTGRRQAMDEILFVTTDRRGRELVLGPTHEELMTDLVSRQLQSYRDLPMRPYQIQAKFRDEPRPRGGTIRTRQFTMMDLYSYDADEDGLKASYEAMRRAYTRVFERCAVPTVTVEADSGAMGGT